MVIIFCPWTATSQLLQAQADRALVVHTNNQTYGKDYHSG